MKFDGRLGRMMKRHKQYAKHGRSRRPGKQARFSITLEASVADVMTGLRLGLDSGTPRPVDPASVNLIEVRSGWLSSQPSATTPLYGHVQHTSRDFRDQIPTGDDLPRVMKKAVKKGLVRDMERYVDALMVSERRHGTNYLGRRVK